MWFNWPAVMCFAMLLDSLSSPVSAAPLKTYTLAGWIVMNCLSDGDWPVGFPAVTAFAWLLVGGRPATKAYAASF